MNIMTSFRSTCAIAAALVFVSASAWAQGLACDVDIDGDIDRDDVALIFDDRNQVARDASDPRDPDRDLKVTVLDARICTQRCTNAECTPATPNRSPIANAGADQAVFPMATVTLNGSASTDPDGDALSYRWSLRVRPAGSAAALDDSTAVMPHFVADLDGHYEVDLIVNDGRIGSAVDTVIVTTLPHNTAPIANAGSDRDAIVGTTVILDGSLSSDIDGNLLAFAWELEARPAGSNAVLVDANQVQSAFVPDVPGTYVARLVVDDGRGGSATDSVEVRTVPANRAPTADAGEDQAAAVGDVITLDGSGSADADGDALQYRWSFVSRPAGSTAALSAPNGIATTFRVDRTGEFVVQLIVNDGSVDSAADTVLVTSSNTPPVANAGEDQTVALNTTVSLDGSASHDANGDALAYLWSIVARPATSTAALVSELSPTPRLTPDVAGIFVVQLIVNDGTIDSAADTVVITVEPPPNAAPLARSDDAIVPFETPTTIDVLANDSDADGDTLAIESVTAPVTGSVVIEGGTIRYTPRAGFSGPDFFHYVVNDGKGGTDTGFVDVTVQPPAGTVTIVESDTIARELGPEPGSFTVIRTGSTANPLTVHYAMLGSAVNGVDYQPLSGFVTIPAGAASAEIAIVPITDAHVEGPESVSLLIQPSADYFVGTPAIASLSIADSIVVTITAQDAQASEATLDPAAFLVSRSGGDLSQPLNVSLSTSGEVNRLGSIDATITNIVGGSIVVIPAGATTTVVTVIPVRDNLVEGVETLTLTLNDSPGYSPGADASATIALADDPTVVTIAASDAGAAEAGRDTATFGLTRTGGNISASLTVFCAFSGAAANSSDFEFTGCSATFAANQTSAAITITPRADNAVEGDETVVATLTTSAANTYAIGTPSWATITIADDPVLITLVATDASAAETGNDSGTLTISRSGGNLAQAMTILLDRGGTATNGLDYTSLPVSTTIAANQASASLTVTPVDDVLIEPSESVTLTVRPAQSYIVVAPGTATVTIASDE